MSTPSAPSVRDKQVRTVASRAEIARRRAVAEAATAGPWTTDTDGCCVGAGAPWRFVAENRDLNGPRPDAAHIAANEPAYVLAVLDIHDALLDAVALHSLCCDCDACTVADRLLDLYAPEPS